MIADVVSLDRARRLRGPASKLVDPVIAKWRCRTFACLVFVGVTQRAIETLALFNVELKRRREKPIEEHQVMYCDSCAAARRSP